MLRRLHVRCSRHRRRQWRSGALAASLRPDRRTTPRAHLSPSSFVLLPSSFPSAAFEMAGRVVRASPAADSRRSSPRRRAGRLGSSRSGLHPRKGHTLLGASTGGTRLSRPHPRDGDSWASRPRRQQWRSGALAASPRAHDAPRPGSSSIRHSYFVIRHCCPVL